MVVEDLKWLGLGITETVTQSDRLSLYYDLCRQLIEKGGAYVCTCDNEHFKEFKQAEDCLPLPRPAGGKEPRTLAEDARPRV